MPRDCLIQIATEQVSSPRTELIFVHSWCQISLPQRHRNFVKNYRCITKSAAITVSGVTKFAHSYAIGIGPIKYSSQGESNGVFGSARGGTESGGVAASPRRAGCVLPALRERPRFVYETALRRRRRRRLRSPACRLARPSKDGTLPVFVTVCVKLI